MKRVLLAAIAAALLLAALVPAASAEEEWCDYDPIIIVTTPGGSTLTFYHTEGAKGLVHQASLPAAQASYTAKHVNGGLATEITITVVVPEGITGYGFETRTVISDGPMKTLTIRGKSPGKAGQKMPVTFTVNVP